MDQRPGRRARHDRTRRTKSAPVARAKKPASLLSRDRAAQVRANRRNGVQFALVRIDPQTVLGKPSDLGPVEFLRGPSLTRLFDSGKTAGTGSRRAPSKPIISAMPADHNDASPRKSRRSREAETACSFAGRCS